MKVDLYTQTGEKNGKVELNKAIFEVPYNEDLIHQALLRQHANKRVAVAHTKTRSEMRGGGRKPYRQKGTGSARQGSRRNPHFRGGSVKFGPRNVRNYTVAMPKKQRRKALFSALSVKAKNGNISALEKYEGDIKTKKFAQLLDKIKIDRNVLIVIPEKNQVIQKSTANLAHAKTVIVNYLNIADLQKYKTILFLKDSLPKMEEVFLSASKA
ncbi:50S ribosomal protein L4 [Candidatus Peregrinibacteria bacterium]|nr:50S ribosomal protein L4 [Candidatus Peregrinibacteria bacterium]